MSERGQHRDVIVPVSLHGKPRRESGPDISMVPFIDIDARRRGWSRVPKYRGGMVGQGGGQGVGHWHCASGRKVPDGLECRRGLAKRTAIDFSTLCGN